MFSMIPISNKKLYEKKMNFHYYFYTKTILYEFLLSGSLITEHHVHINYYYNIL